MINFVPQEDTLSGVKDGRKAVHLEAGALRLWVTSRQGKGAGNKEAPWSPDPAVWAQPGGGAEAWGAPQPSTARA